MLRNKTVAYDCLNCGYTHAFRWHHIFCEFRPRWTGCTPLLPLLFMANTSSFLRLADSPLCSFVDTKLCGKPFLFFLGGTASQGFLMVQVAEKGQNCIVVIKVDMIIQWEYQVPDNFSTCANVGWILRGWSWEFLCLYTRKACTSCGSFTKLVELLYIPGPFTQNVLLESHLASQVDKGFIHSGT